MELQKYYDLTKTFRFESAHRLALGYEGKCANIHGHSWNGKLTVRCYQGLDTMGLGIDFGTIKQQVLVSIEEIFDHKLILYIGDPLVEVLRKFGTAVVTMENNPTSEVIAAFIFDYAKERLNRYSIEPFEGKPEDLPTPIARPLFEVVSVTIDETCTSSCCVTEGAPL